MLVQKGKRWFDKLNLEGKYQTNKLCVKISRLRICKEISRLRICVKISRLRICVKIRDCRSEMPLLFRHRMGN